MAFPIRLDNPRGNACKGNHGSAQGGDARILTLGDVELFFSYATLVAVRAPGLAIRTSEYHSRMTSKHLREMGCESFAQLDPELFAAGARAALAQVGREAVA